LIVNVKNLALIIEDDDDLCVIFDQALQSAQFTTEIIRDGNTATTRLMQVQPALIVLDLHLPGTPGTQLLAQIRRDPCFAHTQVIVASADPRMAESLEGKADLILVKPVSYKQLRDLASRLNAMYQYAIKSVS
jgi:two-component system, OmpR family, response regulator RstA